MSTPRELAEHAATRLRDLTGVERHDVALVLGSGWLPAVEGLGSATAELSTTDLPGFAPPAVAGHAGKIRSIRAGERNLLVFLGRTHLYEGLGVRPVVHGVRTSAAAGCRAVVLTNGAGGLRGSWAPGTPVLISDHLNLTGRSPLSGPNDDTLGPRFLDLTEVYDHDLRERVRAAATAEGVALEQGVYAGLLGPTYETPAEVRMLGILGAHAVGMSTVLEAIGGRYVGMRVVAVSLVTNKGAGLSPTVKTLVGRAS